MMEFIGTEMRLLLCLTCFVYEIPGPLMPILAALYRSSDQPSEISSANSSKSISKQFLHLGNTIYAKKARAWRYRALAAETTGWRLPLRCVACSRPRKINASRQVWRQLLCLILFQQPVWNSKNRSTRLAADALCQVSAAQFLTRCI